MKHFYAVFLMMFLVACTSSRLVDEPMLTPHPALKKLQKYAAVSRESAVFDSSVSGFFTPTAERKIATAMGWRKYVFSSVYIGLRNGNCTSEEVEELGSSSVQIDCWGPFTYRSMLLGASQQKMFMRIWMRNIGGTWLIERSGLIHTQPTGNLKEVIPYGVKLPENLLYIK